MSDETYNPECRLCGLHHTRKYVVRGKGDINAKILCLGEGPGKDEDMAGWCFVGKAGRNLEGILQYAWLSYAGDSPNVYIDNIARCRPVEGDFGGRIKNRPPNDIEISECSRYTISLINTMMPRLIITLGVTSTNYMARCEFTQCGVAFKREKSPVFWKRGTLFYVGGISVLPLYHPSYMYCPASRAEETWKHIDDNRDTIEKILTGAK